MCVGLWLASFTSLMDCSLLEVAHGQLHYCIFSREQNAWHIVGICFSICCCIINHLQLKGIGQWCFYFILSCCFGELWSGSAGGWFWGVSSSFGGPSCDCARQWLELEPLSRASSFTSLMVLADCPQNWLRHLAYSLFMWLGLPHSMVTELKEQESLVEPVSPLMT